MSSLEKAPFSAKGIAPFLTPDNPERVEACARASNLIFETRDGAKVFKASQILIEPLLALLPIEPAAANPLATLAYFLTDAHAYPEALVCIDAIIDRSPDRPLGSMYSPWDGGESNPMTWPRQQALLSLWRGECLLAAGDRERGEAALADFARRAEASDIPRDRLSIGGTHSWWSGNYADLRMWSLYQAARALRLRYQGEDACRGRKVPKRKAKDKPDPALLSLARAYLDEVMAVIEPRVAKQFAGLVPTDTKHPGYTTAHLNASWQQYVYFESGLLYEQLGELDKARLHVGRAKWLFALDDPSHQHRTNLTDAVERLGAVNTPLA